MIAYDVRLLKVFCVLILICHTTSSYLAKSLCQIPQVRFSSVSGLWAFPLRQRIDFFGK